MQMEMGECAPSSAGRARIKGVPEMGFKLASPSMLGDPAEGRGPLLNGRALLKGFHGLLLLPTWLLLLADCTCQQLIGM